MKELKSKSVFESSLFYILLFVNIIFILRMIFTDTSIGAYIGGMLIGNLIFCLMISSAFNEFKYDENKLIITNPFKPHFIREFNVKGINTIKLISDRGGRAIKLRYYGSIETHMADQVDVDMLRLMVKEINDFIAQKE